MNASLKRAFDEAAKLPPEAQDVLAARLMAELEAEDDFDRAIAASADRLAVFAAEALKEFEAGETEELDLDRLP